MLSEFGNNFASTASLMVSSLSSISGPPSQYLPAKGKEYSG